MLKCCFLMCALMCWGLGAGQVYDLVVYGGSSAGIAAAVQAKRMGLSVVVIEPSYRIGGLTTGGLGQTDIGNKSAFGGIALEFYTAVRTWYNDPAHWKYQTFTDYSPDGQCTGTRGAKTMWTFEPSAALAILQGWVNRDGITLVYGERLNRKLRDKQFIGAKTPSGVTVDVNGVRRLSPVCGVEKVNGRIVALKMESGRVFRGRYFVDATYEGDLMAAAGVAYTLGREGNARYGETLNGFQPHQGYHNFYPGVDPYVEKGNPASGLLPGIEPFDATEKEGQGDTRVQAYCLRMCLTDVPENRIPFEKPVNYNEREFELLFRDFEQGAIHPECSKSLRVGGIGWINSKMPCRKTDTNNRCAFSTDAIGLSWTWAEGSYEERADLFQRHLQRQKGLMWTLANHPRVPEKVRNEVRKWGTCKDEFLDKSSPGGGWQGQLYVREARRMIGAYVMTEQDCCQQRKTPNPVAKGAYGMDSHHVRRRVGADGFVHNEGDVQVRVAKGPYGIAYGAITPVKSDCENLLVPICVSASHIAYGSIRMEPVFFALGQVSGTAAGLAIKKGVAVQDVDYAELAKRLAADGQVF